MLARFAFLIVLASHFAAGQSATVAPTRQWKKVNGLDVRFDGSVSAKRTTVSGTEFFLNIQNLSRGPFHLKIERAKPALGEATVAVEKDAPAGSRWTMFVKLAAGEYSLVAGDSNSRLNFTVEERK